MNIENCSLFFACSRFLIFHPFFQGAQLSRFAPMRGRRTMHRPACVGAYMYVRSACCGICRHIVDTVRLVRRPPDPSNPLKIRSTLAAPASEPPATFAGIGRCCCADYTVNHCTLHYGRRAFCFSGPYAWNSLPEHIRQSSSIAV